MMRSWNRTVVVALGALFLAGASAWAAPKKPNVPNVKLPPQQPRPANLSCDGHCKVDTKECYDLCDMHAKQAGSICTNSCNDMEKECLQACKQSEREH